MKRGTLTTLTIPPGTLWESVVQRTQHALQCHALQPIPTDYQFIEQEGIRFLVRIVSNLARKERSQKKQEGSDRNFNPFLPYEEDLWVADLSPTHVCLLNKYNVVDYHLLIITRDFEDQENWLSIADFEALWFCLTEFDGLGFYNSGKLAGASQQHKHLQVVPLPFTGGGPSLPIEPVIASVPGKGKLGTIPAFPFPHAFVQLDWDGIESSLQGAQVLLKNYLFLLEAIGLVGEGKRPSGAYNLLVTRQWMGAIPRSQESFASISVNSLGFAGALLVRNQQQLEYLKEWGPIAILQEVAG